MKTAAVLLATILLCACSGGGSGSDPIQGAPPADFSGSWALQIATHQDTCTSCADPTNALAIMTVTQAGTAIDVSIGGDIGFHATGTVEGTTFGASGGAVSLHSWTFSSSSASINGSTYGSSIAGSGVISPSALSPACIAGCPGTPCICQISPCLLSTPCSISFTYTGQR